MLVVFDQCDDNELQLSVLTRPEYETAPETISYDIRSSQTLQFSVELSQTLPNCRTLFEVQVFCQDGRCKETGLTDLIEVNVVERSGDIWEVLIVTDSPDFIG